MKRYVFLFLLVFVLSLSIKASPYKSEQINLLKSFPPNAVTKQWADSLVKYMPQIDLVSVTDSFLISDLNAIVKAKKQVPWAYKVPKGIFYRYILPYRVSQEPLNDFRSLYVDTLLNVVKNTKDIRSAILKIDDWVTIHNKYKPTAPWDQSPIVTLKRGYGRCEEMATLLIMSLRTVYIPARFVYTPWWPYTNSNHAWVEVWVNGKWEYIGKLKNPNDWVVAATKRTALVAGTVWGKVTKSAEPILNSYRMFTIFNSTSNYENTKTLSVKVVDKNNIPVTDSKIYIYVYNYSAFRPIASGKSDSSGLYKIEVGKTDLIVTAGKDEKFAWGYVGKKDNTLTLQLSDNGISDTSFWFYTIPPVTIRNKGKKYISPDTTYLAQKLYMGKVNPMKNDIKISFPQKDDSLFVDILKSSHGNYKTILDFYNKIDNKKKSDLIKVLNSVYKNDKDLVSIDSADMQALLKWYEINKKKISLFNDTIATSYIISPRIYFEDFGTYKYTFSTIFGNLISPAGIDSTVNNVVQFVESTIDTIPDSLKSRFGGLMNPLEVYRGKIGRPIEKYILSVGILRSLAIPSKLNYMNNGIEYYKAGKWIDLVPESHETVNYSHIKIVFHNKADGEIAKLRYYYDFTINKIEKNRIVSLDLDVADARDTITCDLAPGNYLMIVGWRNTFGTAFVRLNNFKVSSDTLLNIESGVPLNQAKTGNVVMRKLKLPDNQKFKDIREKFLNKRQLYEGKNLILILDMHGESSISTLNRIKFKNWQGKILIFTNSDVETVVDLMKRKHIKCNIFKLTDKVLKKTFHIKTFPSVLVLDRGKTILWVDGFNPDILNNL
ncbi:MAG: hypothetical protein GWP03_01325 [Proteobacteria bacterium]|nr:hypothetical protein [Pseudomonadota bacterium]